MQTEFTLTYDGSGLREHEINVRDLVPAMLGVGEVFKALNRLYNGKAAEVAVNMRAHQPACFTVVFDVSQAIKSAANFLTRTKLTAALNLKEILFGTGGVCIGLILLVRKLKGRMPDRVEKLTAGMFRLFLDGENYDVPVELLEVYKELSVRKALEKFITKPLKKSGIDVVKIESDGHEIERVTEEEAPYFAAPEVPDDIIIDDMRRNAYSISNLSFDEAGLWQLNDGNNPINVLIEDPEFLRQVQANLIRFAKHDVLVCMVHFVQRRTAKGRVANEYTVVEVLEHIPAPRQLRVPEPEDGPDDDIP